MLNLSKNNITCLAAKSVAGVLTACSDKLRVLLIHFNRIMGKGGQEIAAAIRTATALQVLDISYNSITAAGHKNQIPEY